MKVLHSISVVVLALFALYSCEKKEDLPGVLLPSNLQYTIDVSSTTEGFVEVSCTANNANFFTVEYFHSNGSTIIEAKDGMTSFQYQESGKYRILVKAHSTYNEFISQSDSIEVQVNSGGISDKGYSTPISYPGYNLVWNDEFNGSGLTSNWTHEIGRGSNGWGNQELQYYREENTEVRDGYLIITAEKQVFAGAQYTSSRIITSGQQSFKYGRIDVRALLPEGQGIWPAIWMLGDNFWTDGWPTCGEIDIMEMVGGVGSDRGDNHVFGTVHWNQNGQHAEYGGSNKLPSGKYSDEFHVFSIEWDANRIKWFRDDIKFHEINISGSNLDAFKQQFFFIINVAVGGVWPGSPDPNTNFPQFMAVDYVRVFQK